MSGRAFVDTNILVYARDSGAGEKCEKAKALLQELWLSRAGRLSIQVLNEYFVTVTRKLRPGLSPAEAWTEISLFEAWKPIAMDWNLLVHGREIFHTYTLSWWDSLVVAAAAVSDSAILYSEDLQNGDEYHGVKVVNPFA